MKRPQWFRMYNDTLNDPKVRMLDSAERFGIFAGLLTLAGGSPVRGTVCVDENIPYSDKELARLCMTSVKKINETLDILRKFRIISEENRCFTFVNWDARQYDKPSDSPESTRERKQKSRENKEDVTPMSRASHAPSNSSSNRSINNIPPNPQTGEQDDVLLLDVDVSKPYPKPDKLDLDALPPDFELFCSCYPKPVAKRATYRRWYSIVVDRPKSKRVEPSQLALAAKRFAQEMTGRDAQHIKAAEVFLSEADRWYEAYLDGQFAEPMKLTQKPPMTNRNAHMKPDDIEALEDETYGC